ncbi:MAG: ABC transporter permease subunit [Bradyrhizobiaceae bacterium]|nr:ABC transporter permease subunit [Bradyrhizobiaceae bacterium]
MFGKRKNKTKDAAPQTLFQRRWKKFKSLKRGYISLIVITTAYALSWLLPLLVNGTALVVHYNGETYFPAFRELVGMSYFHSKEDFGQKGTPGEVNYRQLQREFEQQGGGNWVIMPLYPYGPIEDINIDGNKQFLGPLEADLAGGIRAFGTDDRGRDVFARMAYGFNVSLSFALCLAFLEYLIGLPIGMMSGYFGGWFDTILQRFIEIWSTLPMLFIIIIVVSLMQPSFILLVLLLSITTWIGICWLMRAEYLREKSKDYVAAAISIGVPTRKILFKHILPNSLVPIITYFPFAVVAGIGALVSLDFLGFGLAPPTPSWGEMVHLGLENITTDKWWLVVAPLTAMFTTLLLTVFVGESVREAFDPKVFSRLR